MRPREWNLAQRVVAVIALAGLLRVIASYVIDRFIAGDPWFGYVPLTAALSDESSSFGVTIVWLVAVVVWAWASLWLFGLPDRRSGSVADRPRDQS